MLKDTLAMFCYVDLSGQVRGKGFPASQLQKRLKSGIGWTPNNIMFTTLGTIAPGLWGAHGDVQLMPDPDTKVEVDFEDGSPAERFYLCDVQNTDGSPWDCCPRSVLKDAIAQLKARTGLTIKATFEHEFIYSGANSRAADNYALDAVRRHGAFGETYLGALKAAGVTVDSYLPEFAPGQFEVTVPPQDALAACDTAIKVRELAYSTARRLGQSVSFSPRVKPDGLGSGVHIHFSLWDEKGRPASYDPERPFGISEKAGQFLSGIIRHLPALCAITAPTPVSYLRLVSHSWTGVWSNVGFRDREAGLRICPTFGTSPEDVARQFNFEYRAADATANPYLQLALIMKAGLSGMVDGLESPRPTVEEDPETMSAEERDTRKIVRLPQSLEAALDALQADKAAQAFLPEMLLKAYVANKKAELAMTRDWSPDEICRRYAEVF